MPTFLLVILTVLGLVLAIGGLPLLLAAGDPEGRGAGLVIPGVICLFGGAASFLVFGIWALVRWAH